jgi:hypothetical protein
MFLLNGSGSDSQSSHLLLALATTVILCFRPCGNHDHIFLPHDNDFLASLFGFWRAAVHLCKCSHYQFHTLSMMIILFWLLSISGTKCCPPLLSYVGLMLYFDVSWLWLQVWSGKLPLSFTSSFTLGFESHGSHAQILLFRNSGSHAAGIPEFNPLFQIATFASTVILGYRSHGSYNHILPCHIPGSRSCWLYSFFIRLIRNTIIPTVSLLLCAYFL